jgi:hypothetical protein
VNLIPIIEAVKFHANEWKSALGHRLAGNTKRLLLEFRDILMVSFVRQHFTLFLVTI